MDNTAKDAARAKAAGLSYGYWKLDNPNTKPVEKKQETNKVCPECGTAFFNKRTDRVYCSEECRRRKGNRDYVMKLRGGNCDAVPEL